MVGVESSSPQSQTAVVAGATCCVCEKVKGLELEKYRKNVMVMDVLNTFLR